MDLLWYLSIAGLVGYSLYRITRDDSVRESLKKLGRLARASGLGRATVVGGSLVFGWLVLEALVLSGPRIYEGPLLLGEPFPLEITRAEGRYVFTVGRPSGRRKGRPGHAGRVRLEYTITGPDGSIALREADAIGRKIRRFHFRPGTPGTYTLQIAEVTSTGRQGLSWLRINRNDRSVVLYRVGHLWPIELGIWSPFHPREQIPGHQVDWVEWAGQR